MKNPRGPAAVNGDETRRRHCSRFGEWEGAGSRMNHEPEDLPGELTLYSLVGWGIGEDDIAGAILRVLWPWGFFICRGSNITKGRLAGLFLGAMLLLAALGDFQWRRSS